MYIRETKWCCIELHIKMCRVESRRKTPRVHLGDCHTKHTISHYFCQMFQLDKYNGS